MTLNEIVEIIVRYVFFKRYKWNGSTAHADDRMPYQGVDGVLAFKNSDGQIDVKTPGSLTKVTIGAQKASG